MTLRDIERILYFEAFVVVDPGMTPLRKWSIAYLKKPILMQLKNMVMNLMRGWVLKPFRTY